MRTQFKMEKIVYTQDSTYGHSLQEEKGEEAEEENNDVDEYLVQRQNTETTLREMARHLRSYYRVSTFLGSIKDGYCLFIT